MRFIHPPNNSYRVRCNFLLFPKRIKSETRWLEKAMWLERYDDSGYWYTKKWIPFIKSTGSFFEVYNDKILTDVPIAVIKVKNKNILSDFSEELFDEICLFGCADKKYMSLNYIFKEITIKQLPLYVNMRATEEGRKLLESL